MIMSTVADRVDLERRTELNNLWVLLKLNMESRVV